MPPLSEKYRHAVDEAAARLLARASDSRGLEVSEIAPRLGSAVDKYLADDDGKAAVAGFIEEIRADDLCLIIACERGDEKAWEDLVSNFDATVKAAARKISANSEDAEDLASSIWAELYGLRRDADGRKKSKLSYYSGRGSLAGWLRAVVSQLAVDQFRKDSRFVQVEEDREFDNLANDAAENSDNRLVAHTDTPEEIFTTTRTEGDVAEALRHAISSLEAEDKLILKLYYFDDLKLKDIAATFGYHEATASRKLVRIQANIRKAVERALREHHGWNDGEVKHYLSETASKLGLSMEKLLTALILFAIVQDISVSGVL